MERRVKGKIGEKVEERGGRTDGWIGRGRRSGKVARSEVELAEEGGGGDGGRADQRRGRQG